MAIETSPSSVLFPWTDADDLKRKYVLTRDMLADKLDFRRYVKDANIPYEAIAQTILTAERCFAYLGYRDNLMRITCSYRPPAWDRDHKRFNASLHQTGHAIDINIPARAAFWKDKMDVKLKEWFLKNVAGELGLCPFGLVHIGVNQNNMSEVWYYDENMVEIRSTRVVAQVKK